MGSREELSPHGYHVIILSKSRRCRFKRKQLNTLLNAQVDGIFMSVSKTTEDIRTIEAAKESNTPIIFLTVKKNMQESVL